MLLSLDRLEPGMRVSRDVLNSNSAVLLPAGAELTADILRRLEAWGVDGVHVAAAEEQEPAAFSQPISSEILQEAEELIDLRLKHITQQSPLMEAVREIAVRRAARRIQGAQQRTA